ncbi:DNA translocase FtsK, partial [Streptococcus pyogenes]|uniref:DNA translocase FtsK n=1 Tax=Streptococcus pyogenes TaxID=1314 RepID=UPI0037DA4C08
MDLREKERKTNQTKEKKGVRQKRKMLEEKGKSFGIDVKVERAEIGPSKKKEERKKEG